MKPPVIFGRYDLRTDKEAYYYLCVAAVAVVIYLSGVSDIQGSVERL